MTREHDAGEPWSKIQSAGAASNDPTDGMSVDGKCLR